MNITKTSPLTGQTNTLFIEGLTQEMIDRWRGGELVQVALAGIPQELREFVMTGITPQEWQQCLPPEEDVAPDAEGFVPLIEMANLILGIK